MTVTPERVSCLSSRDKMIADLEQILDSRVFRLPDHDPAYTSADDEELQELYNELYYSLTAEETQDGAFCTEETWGLMQRVLVYLKSGLSFEKQFAKHSSRPYGWGFLAMLPLAFLAILYAQEVIHGWDVSRELAEVRLFTLSILGVLAAIIRIRIDFTLAERRMRKLYGTPGLDHAAYPFADLEEYHHYASIVDYSIKPYPKEHAERRLETENLPRQPIAKRALLLVLKTVAAFGLLLVLWGAFVLFTYSGWLLFLVALWPFRYTHVVSR